MEFKNFSISILTLSGKQINIPNEYILQFSLNKDILQPSDTFAIEILDKEELQEFFKIGNEIQIKIDKINVINGYIESASFSNSRSSKSFQINGRDKLGLITDITLSPEFKISENVTYFDAIKAAISESNLGITKFDTSKTGIKSRKITDKLPRQLRPAKSEGIFEFIQKIMDYSGWNIKLIDDTIHIFEIDYKFELNSIAKLIHENILSYSIDCEFKKYPTYIIGEMTGGSKNFRKIKSTKLIRNILFPGQDSITDEVIAKFKYKEVKSNIASNQQSIAELLNIFFDSNSNQNIAKTLSKPLYITTEAKTLEELDFKLQRTISDIQNEIFTLNLTLPGWDSDNILYKINDIIQCKLKFLNNDLKMYWWIQKINYTKSKSGTTCKMTCKPIGIY